ncbi:MAG TPA: NAD-dependent epimerase/dehydratase family protein [Gemmatimonadaceae bacterium]|nr:NAD-dependent epimerase/dehydratase family protein [Gemmatimonadaceae bacterium]
MNRILITGGTGFLGANVARRLRDRGGEVRLFARAGARAERLRAEGFEVASGDIGDREAVERAVKGCSKVVHLAATYRQEGLPLREFHRVNVFGTENVIGACVRQGIDRLVHVSTVGVYGRITDPPAAEDHPCVPDDHYQRTKYQAELLARRAGEEGLRDRVVILRPTGVYGPGDLRFLKLYRSVAHGRFIFPGRGLNWYHPTYLDDALDGFELALGKREAVGGIFHICGARFFRLREYVGTIARAMDVPEPTMHVPLWPLRVGAHVCEKLCRPFGVEPPIFPRRVAFFYLDRAFKIDKARHELGFEPRVDLEEGARRTAAWYRDNGYIKGRRNGRS